MYDGYEKNSDFRVTSRFISETIQDMATVTMEHEQELLRDLSNSAIINDRERPLIQISRTRHYSMLNISETVQDIDIVIMESHTSY